MPATLTLNEATGEATVSMSVTVGDNPKFVRGIHKVGFELLAFDRGPASVLGREYDPVRAFVRRGFGRRHVMMRSSPTHFYRVEPPFTDGRGGYAMRFSLMCCEFWVDLTPTQGSVASIVRGFADSGDWDGWWCCPTWKQSPE